MFDFKLFSLSWLIPFGLSAVCQVISPIVSYARILLKKDVKMNKMDAFKA